MANLLRRLWLLLNKDLTGREEVIESEHPYFGKTVYFGRKNEEGGYWEAELMLPGAAKPVGIIIPAGRDGPSDADVRSCQALLGDLDALFARCRLAFEAEYPRWIRRPFPSAWREGFVLDGVSLPKNADPDTEWDVCYFVNAVNHYFTARFLGGRVQEVIVDG